MIRKIGDSRRGMKLEGGLVSNVLSTRGTSLRDKCALNNAARR